MPYYLYEIVERPIRQLKKIADYPSYKEAGAAAKAARAAGTANVKVMFAENELQAEDLLSQVRVAPPVLGDDI